MSKNSTKSRKVKITDEVRKLYEERDKSLDAGEIPQLSPDEWAKAQVGVLYRPMKTAISLRIDNDILAWLKAQGDGHLSRINTILRSAMTRQLRVKR